MKVIYKIVNKVNGKIYIGSTINYKRRIKVHLSRLDKNDQPIQARAAPIQP